MLEYCREMLGVFAFYCLYALYTATSLHFWCRIRHYKSRLRCHPYLVPFSGTLLRTSEIILFNVASFMPSVVTRFTYHKLRLIYISWRLGTSEHILVRLLPTIHTTTVTYPKFEACDTGPNFRSASSNVSLYYCLCYLYTGSFFSLSLF